MNERHDTLRGRRVLLLQGPVGPFFRRLALSLEAAGAVVHKVNFNGGDWFFYPRRAISWQGPLESWPQHFAALLERLRIDIVVVFGDCRPVHRIACRIAHERGVQVGAFEEGYIRPNFVTFERFGVNGYSLVPRERRFYAALPAAPRTLEREFPRAYGWAALWAALYYISSAVAYPLFRRHRHHRPLTLLEALPWTRAGWRKLAYAWSERRVLPLLTGALSKRFFLVPLQLSLDSQVHAHSQFASVADFIRDVVASFAARAPGDVSLVVKHHPLDRGHHEYGGLIRELAREHRLEGRLLYIHDQHLPTLFHHMRGAVVINSTVGLSVLTHGAPLKTLGRAIYDLEGLTFQGPLDQFWRAAESFRPDVALLRRFRSYLIDHTQINGSFYAGAISATAGAAALSLARALDGSRAQPREAPASRPRQQWAGPECPRVSAAR